MDQWNNKDYADSIIYFTPFSKMRRMDCHKPYEARKSQENAIMHSQLSDSAKASD